MTIVIDTNERRIVEAFVKKEKIADQERQKARAQKEFNVPSNITHQRRERQRTKTKNLRSQGQFCLETVSQKDGEKCFWKRRSPSVLRLHGREL